MICPTCNGAGMVAIGNAGSRPDRNVCPVCAGTKAIAIVKTSSHRSRNSLIRRAPYGAIVGPYGKGPSIFDRVDGEFWLVPERDLEKVLTVRGVAHAKTTTIDNLNRFNTTYPVGAP